MNTKKKKNNVNRGKIAPTVVPQKKPMSQKTKNFLAYVLAALMVLWSIGSLFGFIGFVRTLDADAQTIDAVPQTIEDVSASTVSVGRHQKRKQGLYNYYADTGEYRFEIDAMRGFMFYNLYGSGISYLSTFPTIRASGPFRYLEFRNGLDSVVIDGIGGGFTWEFYDTEDDAYYTEVCRVSADRYSFPDTSMFVPIAYYFSVNYDQSSALWSMGITIVERNYTVDTEVLYEWHLTLTMPFIDDSGAMYNTYFNDFVGVNSPRQDIRAITFFRFLTEDASGRTYFDGYDDGYDVGYNNGYDSGYYIGTSDGFDDGYSQGVDDAGSYSFMSLFAAVVDSQVEVFYGLFEFELLGVDLSSFFLAMLTVCAIITVIKMFL